MSDLNYYEILGISKDASSNDIKKAFKASALTQHPDKGGTVDSFACIQEAYMVLYDPEKRKDYDISHQIHINTTAHHSSRSDHMHMYPNEEEEGLTSTDTDTASSDSPNSPDSPVHQNINYKSSHIHMTILVTLEDIANRKLFTIQPIRLIPCSICRGSGGVAHKIVDCVLCEGNGVYSTIMGDIMFCGRCRGSGKIVIEAAPISCPKCRGLCYFKKTFTFYVSAYHVVGHSIKYPDKSPVIVFYGQGNHLRNKCCGDLVIHFYEIHNCEYIRSQINISYTKYLTLYDALYGLTFDITTIQKKKLRVILDPILNLDDDKNLEKAWFEQIIPNEGLENPEKNGYGNLNIIFKIIIPNLSNTNQETLKHIFLSSQNKLKSPTKDTSIVKLKIPKPI
jgi:DnaJ family protein A protein 2